MGRESGRLVRLAGVVLGLRSRIGRRYDGFPVRRGRRRLRRFGRIFRRRTHCHCRDEESQLGWVSRVRFFLLRFRNRGTRTRGWGRAHGFLSGWYFLLRRR